MKQLKDIKCKMNFSNSKCVKKVLGAYLRCLPKKKGLYCLKRGTLSASGTLNESTNSNCFRFANIFAW